MQWKRNPSVNVKRSVKYLVFSILLAGMNCHAATTEGLVLNSGETMKNLPAYLAKINGQISDAEIQSLVETGQLTEAAKRLREAARMISSPTTEKIYEQEANRLDQLRREFSLTSTTMLSRIREKIPDATAVDLRQWTAENQLSWIPVDGEIRYFRREPGILLRLNKDAKARAAKADSGDPAGKAKSGFSFTGHLRAALDAAKDSGSSIVLPMRFNVTHTITLKPGKVKPGETVRCWMPYPREDSPQQGQVKLISMKPQGKAGTDAESPQRTVYFEQPAGPDGGARFELKFQYVCAAFVPDLSQARDELTAAEKQKLAPYLKGREPHLALTDAVRQLSARIVGDEKTVTGKAFKIWSWLDKNIPWCPEMEYVVMPDIVDKVITERRGDCGTQALTFIALSRAAGVPARWQSGWVTKPGGWNMHDWAEFYAPGLGWLPADPSVGRQESDDPAVRDFLFGHIDSYRMIANRDNNGTFVPAKKTFRSDPVDNQRGELEWSGGNLGYDDWSYDVKVESEAAD